MKMLNDSAVSPVVGVMLMLVVTIIIAAVVSAFAGGLSSDTGKAPQASIECSVELDDTQFIFEHKGGDAFALKDTKVVLVSEDTKSTLTKADIGGNVIAFEEIGTTDDMITPGDKFILKGSPHWSGGIAFGSLGLYPNTKIQWTILDKATDKAIASGSIALV
jgi:FlaG/FlaF family flagellin (archaellin)